VFFGIITRQAIRRGTFTSVRALIDSGQAKIPVGGHFISLSADSWSPFHGHRDRSCRSEIQGPSGATLEVSNHARAASPEGL
jgi:hypothetical protein